MKGLNKLVLASAIAAVSAGAQAELKSLDDSVMGNLTGQAGITIDLDANVTVGEIAYKDEGFVAIKGFQIGGSNLNDAAGTGQNTSLDNIRIEIDVAGAGEQFNYGTSKIQEYGVANLALRNAQAGGALIGAATAADIQTALVDVATNGAGAAAGSVAIYNQMDTSWLAAMAVADNKKSYNEGDLVIHVTATEIVNDPNVLVGDFATAEADMIDAVDFGMAVSSVSLEGENYIDASGQHTGSSGNSTTLVSNISMAGYIGPVDIVIHNNGNLADDSVVGTSTSTIDVNAYFKVTNMDMDVDVMGVNVRGLKVNNSRGSVNGLDGTDSLGFAHAQMSIAATQNTINDGVTLDPTTGGVVYGKTDGLNIGMKFAGDVDVASITFGDSAASIGSIYMTDIVVDATMAISAH